jgi:hypothetical protein
MEAIYETKEEELKAGRLNDFVVEYGVQLTNGVIAALKAKGAEVVEDGLMYGAMPDPLVNDMRLFTLIEMRTVGNKRRHNNPVTTIEMLVRTEYRDAYRFLRKLKKDGSFDFDAIAERVLWRINTKKASIVNNAERARLAKAAHILSERPVFQNLPSGVSIEWNHNTALKVVGINPETDVEKLTRLVEFLKTL